MRDFKHNNASKLVKAPLKSQAFLDKSAKQRSSSLARIIYKILFVLFICEVAYVFLFSSFLQIETTIVQGNQEIESSAITQEVKATLAGRYFGMISKNNFVLFSDSAMEKVLAEKFKKISEVSVSKKFPNIITISIQERKSLLVWCAGDQCYLIDEKGVAYANADFASPEVTENHLIKLVDISAKSVAIGDSVLDEGYLQYVLQIKDGLKNGMGIDTGESYETPSAVSEEVSVMSQDGLKFLFSTHFSLDNAIKNLKLFIAKTTAVQNILTQIEYVDLRSDGKIFYKSKNALENSNSAANMDASAQTTQQQKIEAEKKAADSKKK